VGHRYDQVQVVWKEMDSVAGGGFYGCIMHMTITLDGTTILQTHLISTSAVDSAKTSEPCHILYYPNNQPSSLTFCPYLDGICKSEKVSGLFIPVSLRKGIKPIYK
jgi:hypothetical protein